MMIGVPLPLKQHSEQSPDTVDVCMLGFELMTKVTIHGNRYSFRSLVRWEMGGGHGGNLPDVIGFVHDPRAGQSVSWPSGL